MRFGIICLSFLMVSCASYIDKMHQSFDASDNKRRRVRPKVSDKFAIYRTGQQNMNNSPSTATHRNLRPSVQRNYQPEAMSRKRYRADDLTDSQNTASLWGNDDDAQFLFTQATEKKAGEIILINVNTKLKKAITAELKRAYPDPPPIKKVDPAAKDGEKKEGDKAAATPAKKPTPAAAPEAEAGTIHDRISSVIIEKINKNHLLLKGRKTILYKKRKRTIEVQALISKKNITSDDAVNSDDILESTVRVVR